MSEILKAVILGIIQGLTEFLPVSSSGHLEIAKYFLGTDFNGDESLLMSVVLHAATALSTIYVFRKQIGQIFKGLFVRGCNVEKRFSIFVVISMIPAAAAGLFFEEQLSALFDGKIVFVAFMLIITGVLLVASDYVAKRELEVDGKKAFLIGLAQAVALIPGISRSGATISTAVILGIDKEKAAAFSFLMVLPLILGKMAKDIMDGTLGDTALSASSLTLGFFAALITGVVACTWMIKLVKNSNLRYFGYYCFVVALVILGLLAF